jgi:hypothetical protein
MSVKKHKTKNNRLSAVKIIILSLLAGGLAGLVSQVLAAGATYNLTSSLADRGTVSGNVSWSVTLSPQPYEVQFYIDGVKSAVVDHSPPFVYNGDGATLDTTKLSNGQHTLQEMAIYDRNGGTTYDPNYVDTGATISATHIITVDNSSVTQKPTIPTGLLATAGDGKVTLNWNPNPSSDQVDTYQVYWTTSSTWANNQYLNVPGTSYTATGLTNGTVYYFRVSAHNIIGYGDWNSPISATPTGSTQPPNAYVDAAVSLTTSGAKLDNFTLRDQRRTSDGTAGFVVTNDASNTEISNFDIGPTSDNNILLYTHDHGGHYIHDGKLHDSATPAYVSYGTHGIYDTAKDTKVLRVESYRHPQGACFSIRQPNQYVQVTAHDSAAGIGITDYSTGGQTYNLTLREYLAYNLTRVAVQMDGVHLQWGSDTNLGNENWGVEIDHATLDLRGMSPEWYGAPISFGPTHHAQYITNSIIIWDGAPGAWLQRPSNGAPVDLTGTVVLTSAQAAQYLSPKPYYVPLRVSGSLLIGKASSFIPPRTAALGYPSLSDVGRFQAP